MAMVYLCRDVAFLFGTEFHASYLSNRFIIDMNPAEINVKAVQNEMAVNLIRHLMNFSLQ